MFKKISSIAIAVVMILTMCVTAFAGNDHDSTECEGYINLDGWIYENNTFRTRVDKNPDNAYTTIRAKATNRAGKTLNSMSKNGDRGEVQVIKRWYDIPDEAYALYGTHGIQGGHTYSSDAVYTYTQV